MNDMNPRIAYIDSTRAILIAMVVLGHILNGANPGYDIIPYTLAQEFMDSFHMPAFFILSGMLLNVKKWHNSGFGKYLLHRAYTLLVPYIFFETLAILYKHFVLGAVSIADGLYLMATVRCNVGANWFLPAMFLAAMIYYLYILYPNKAVWSIISVLLLAVLPHLPEGHVWVLLFRGVLGFVFMFAGSLLKEYLTKFTWWKVGAAFLLAAASSAVCFRFSLGSSFYDGTLKGPLLYLISGICGAYFVMGIARVLNCRALSLVGENALTIMGTHQLVLYTIPKSASILWIIGTFALIAAVEAALIFTVNRFCPFLVGKSRKEG